MSAVGHLSRRPTADKMPEDSGIEIVEISMRDVGMCDARIEGREASLPSLIRNFHARPRSFMIREARKNTDCLAVYSATGTQAHFGETIIA